MKKSESKSKTSSNPISPEQAGLLIVFSAPSGCGKTTVVDRLLKRHPEWIRSVSVTTRAPREGEKNGTDYFFVSEKAFGEMDVKGELLESAKVFDQYYGTPKTFIMDHLESGKTVVMTIDVQGTKSIKKTLNKAVSLLTLFLLPPSVKVLRERLEGRKTESPEQVQRRIEIAQDEIKDAGIYDYTVMNHNLDQTISEIEDCIEKFQNERRQQ